MNGVHYQADGLLKTVIDKNMRSVVYIVMKGPDTMVCLFV